MGRPRGRATSPRASCASGSSEQRRNVSLRIEETDSPDALRVTGRGELQLAILIETMRREGYELQVSKPTIITREDRRRDARADGAAWSSTCRRTTSASSRSCSRVRKGKMTKMSHAGSGRVRLEFSVPSRGLIGFRSHFLTETRGTGIMNALFDGWIAVARPDPGAHQRRHGRRPRRRRDAVRDLPPAGARHDLHPAGTRVYEGMVVGEYSRDNDLDVNLCREKKLTNMRASGHDENVVITPHREMGLDAGLEWIGDDELVEVTPRSMRLRKKILPGNLRSVKRNEPEDED